MSITDPDLFERSQPKRLTFDPTINAGHLLTFAGMAFMMFAGWNLMDKRVVVLEEAKSYQVLRDNSQDANTLQRLTELKEAVKDVKDTVGEIRHEQIQRGAAQSRARP
jgi:hypothetical protein